MKVSRLRFFGFLTRRLLSSFLLITFVSTNHLSLPLYAAAPESHVAAGRPVDLASIRLPEGMGRVEEAFDAVHSVERGGDRSQELSPNAYTLSANPFVILIQDAHAIPDAQQSIRKIIAHFQKEYGVRQVALEGASGELDTQIFQSFPDKARLEKTFEDFSAKGELAGGVAAALFSPGIYPNS